MPKEGTRAPLPLGTQVVVRLTAGVAGHGDVTTGSVGEVVSVPETRSGTYRVRFPSGAELALPRRQLESRKKLQKEAAGESLPVEQRPLLQCVAFRCVVGSRAYGLERDGSDTDRRGFYIAPSDLHWSFAGAPEQLEDHSSQECYWELQKFLILALRANPNVLECLYTPLVEFASPAARELLGMRCIFLSKLVYQTYSGYVMSQFKKLSTDLRLKGAIRWKHPMHLIRLLLSGITVLSDGFVPLRIDEHRGSLLEIRDGKWKWAEVNAWRLRLHRQFDQAYAKTRLPDAPDFSRANNFLIRVRRAQVEGTL